MTAAAGYTFESEFLTFILRNEGIFLHIMVLFPGDFMLYCVKTT